MQQQDYENDLPSQYPYKYKRLTVEDLKNEDAVITLCEVILSGIREEAMDILDKLNHHPWNKDLHNEARNMYRYLMSTALTAMSFGGSASLADEFKRRCPREVFESHDNR